MKASGGTAVPMRAGAPDTVLRFEADMKPFALLLACALPLVPAAVPLPATAQVPQADGVLLGGPFALTDQYGRVVTDERLARQYTLLYFGYISCPDVCPTSLQTMSVVMDLLGGDADRVQPLFVTIDPERDTRALMKEYLANFHPRILGLTGPSSMVAAMARAYRIKAERYPQTADGSDYLMDHTSSLILMGPGGIFVERFGHGLAAEEIARRMRAALAPR